MTETFLFTDIEGSTRLWEVYGQAMATALARHDAVVRTAIESNGGEVFKTLGDAFCSRFEDPAHALQATIEAQRDLAAIKWAPLPDIKVRMAVYAGTSIAREGDYFGPVLNRVSRFLAAGHGGQVLVSRSAAELLRDRLPDGAVLHNLGIHRLRDLQFPEEVWQLEHPSVPGSFPPIRTLRSETHNLPTALSSLVGREDELKKIRQRILEDRLVTLIGAGGTGKTRLAIQAASQVLDVFPEGVWFADLSSVTEGSLVAATVAKTLGLREEAGQSPLENVVNFLTGRKLLLLLDNCEHVLEAAATFADAIGRQCRQITLLATSRQPLGITGERTFRVPSLECPPPSRKVSLEQLGEFGAIRLFVERAQGVASTFRLTEANQQAVRTVCTRLDGIPLAIELAAARVQSMPVERIADRLDQRFRLLGQAARGAVPRQQTLRAMIDWSYDLLQDNEKSLLRRLSVFLGGWALEAAEEVAEGGEIDSYDILDLQAALVEKSLVQYDDAEGRYRLLETVRQYGRELLAEAGEEAEFRINLLRYCRVLAERAEPELLGPAARSWLDVLEAERGNFRTAIESAIAFDQLEEGVGLAVALTRFYQQRAHLVEGRWALESLLAKVDQFPPLDRARALRSYAVIVRVQGDLETAQEFGQKALALFQEIGDVDGAASAMTALGIVALNSGRPEEAKRYHEDSLKLRREQENLPLMALCLNNLGVASFRLGDLAGAIAYYEEALALNRQIGNRLSQAYNLGNLAEIHLRQGEPRRTLDVGMDSLNTLMELGDRAAVSQLLLNIAVAVEQLGDPSLAAETFGAQDHLMNELGLSRAPIEREEYDRDLERLRATLGNEELQRLWGNGAQVPLEQIVERLGHL